MTVVLSIFLSSYKQVAPAFIAKAKKYYFSLMGTKGTTSYRIGDQNAPHYITIATIGWVDIFTRKRYKDIIVESLVYCRANKGLEIHGYCIMSNHIHLICRAKEGNQLSDILRDFKRHTAKQILQSIQDESESRREWLLSLLVEAGS